MFLLLCERLPELRTQPPQLGRVDLRVTPSVHAEEGLGARARQSLAEARVEQLVRVRARVRVRVKVTNPNPL